MDDATLIYLDNAATSFPKAPGMAEAITRFLAESAANPGRAGHRLATAAEGMLDDARLKLTRLIGGADPKRMVFALNGTDALNMAIKCVLGGGGTPTEHVITTVLEHNSVSRPLQSLADAGAIELTRVDCDGRGVVDPEEIKKAIRPATRMVVMTHASNVLGTIQDVAAVGRIAREHDLLFCVDAAQTIGAAPISVEQMNIDLLAFPGHKSLLGPTGTGGLYLGERCPEPVEGVGGGDLSLGTWREGGTGGDSSSPTQPALFPYYLEGGTPNTVGVVGLSASVDYVVERGMEGVLAHERALVQRVIDGLAGDDRFTVYGTGNASGCVGTISIGVAGYEPSDAGSILDDSFEIAVRPGLHCAPYIHKRLGTFPSGTVRVSPGPFNTEQDIDSLLGALREMTV